jgi:hypothetical protein
MQSLVETFLAAEEETAIESLPKPKGFREVAVEHVWLTLTEDLDMFLEKIRPDPIEEIEMWVELGGAELEGLQADDDTIVASIREVSTLTKCVHATREWDAAAYRWRWDMNPTDVAEPLTRREINQGHMTHLKCTIIRMSKGRTLGDLTTTQLTAKLLQFRSDAATHPDPAMQLDGTTAEESQIWEYLETDGLSLLAEKKVMPDIALVKHDAHGKVSQSTDRVNIITYEVLDGKAAHSAPLAYTQNAVSKRDLEDITAEDVAKRQKTISSTEPYTDDTDTFFTCNGWERVVEGGTIRILPRYPDPSEQQGGALRHS